MGQNKNKVQILYTQTIKDMTNREKLWHKCWANENEEEEGLIVTPMGSLSAHISKSVPPRFAKDIVSYNCHSTGHLKTHSEEKSHEWDLSQDIHNKSVTSHFAKDIVRPIICSTRMDETFNTKYAILIRIHLIIQLAKNYEQINLTKCKRNMKTQVGQNAKSTKKQIGENAKKFFYICWIVKLTIARIRQFQQNKKTCLLLSAIKVFPKQNI